MPRLKPVWDGELTKLEIRAIAVEANVDPRSVKNELEAQRGNGKSVRGRPGERIRAAFRYRGLLREQAA